MNVDLSGCRFHELSSLYFHPARFHALCAEVGVALETERTEEISTGVEGGASGGVLGFFTGSSKATRQKRTATKVAVSEFDLVDQACRRALAAQPPRIVPILDPDDWYATFPGCRVMVQAELTVLGDAELLRVGTTRSDRIFDIAGRCLDGSGLEMSCHGSRLRDSTWMKYLLGHRASAAMTCVGLIESGFDPARPTQIQPILIGYMPLPVSGRRWPPADSKADPTVEPWPGG